MIPTMLGKPDIRILAALQANGRLEKTKLADLVGLPPKPFCVWPQQLEKINLVWDYRMEIAGRDAARFVQKLTPRNLSEMAVGRCN